MRVVGPSFEIVSAWAADGIPLTIAYRGMDRYFERYYKKGARRRPVRVDFCDADVRDVFDEWRRAVGLPSSGHEAGQGSEGEDGHERRGKSLPGHLERVVLRLTSARVSGALGADADAVIDRIAQDLDRARASARGLRGEARDALVRRLGEFDRELLTLARGALTPEAAHAVDAEASAELAAFRGTMPADAYDRAHAAAIDRLVRERAKLPVLVYA
ncbi:MAG TPA: hypothetical protein VHZ73_06840 [Vicinamibacterales bacterium]|jgi:hypothetical protein|nr:hypothetical protein [Vicinamibacterales bacterium]